MRFIFLGFLFVTESRKTKIMQNFELENDRGNDMLNLGPEKKRDFNNNVTIDTRGDC
jgi:hypothetical protein